MREEPPKKPRIGQVQAEFEIWEAIQKWAESTEEGNPHAIQWLATVMNWLDGVLDAKEVHHTRVAQLEKWWKKQTCLHTRAQEQCANRQ